MCIYVCLHGCGSTCMCRPEVDVRCPPPLLSTVSIETGSLTEPTASLVKQLSHVYFPNSGITNSWHACLVLEDSFAGYRSPGWQHSAFIIELWLHPLVASCFWGEAKHCLITENGLFPSPLVALRFSSFFL